MSGIQIGNKLLEKPIIQGGMGIGVSRSSLAGAVAREGGMGVVAAAQVGYDSPNARAIRNAFVEQMLHGKKKISFCYNCLRSCNPGKAKYCISQALINAVKGDLDNGLIFASAKIDQIREILSVKEVMENLLSFD